MELLKKKVLFLTGTRADFGKIKPLIERLKGHEDFEYQIFATGMHMLSRYGSTVLEIQKAGFENVYSYVNQDGSINSQMDLVLANTIQGLGLYLREFPPDMIVVHGDRVEALAGAIVGALNNILVAHIEGGEVSGTIDDVMRHAISKLSHIHFVSNEESRNRLLQMGESPDSVLVIGSPDIDIMLSDRLPTLEEVQAKYAIPFKDYGIFVHHPVHSELHSLKGQIAAITAALETSGMNFVAIYPNNDHGADTIMESMRRFRNNPRFRMLPSLRFEHFLTLLRNAKAVVGNSSAGIREAPVYGVPTVNIGTRQRNRFDYPSIVNVPENTEAILEALNRLPVSVLPSRHFGAGRSADLFMEHLRGQKMWSLPRQKQFQDMVRL